MGFRGDFRPLWGLGPTKAIEYEGGASFDCGFSVTSRDRQGKWGQTIVFGYF